MKEEDIIENGLYHFGQDSNGNLDTWCRLNILISKMKNGEWIFADLYWLSDRKLYKLSDIHDRITFMFDLKNTKEVSRYAWKQYDDKDKTYVPMGGSSERYIIKCDAKKSKENVIEILQERIEENKREIDSCKRNIELDTEKLKDVKSGVNIDNIYI